MGSMKPRAHGLAAALALSMHGGGFAQSSGLPAAQRGGTFHEPPPQVDPAYTPDGPNRAPKPSEAAEPKLTLQLTLEMPLDRSRASAGAGAQGAPRGSATVQAQLRWQPVPNWFVQARFYRYLHAARQRSWDPDIAYAFGYESAQPDTFSLVYANYTGTRLRPDRAAGEGRWHFREGVWSAGYKFALPAALQDVFLAGDGDGATCDAKFHWTPRFTTSAGGALARDKLFLSTGCRYATASGWFAQAGLYAYARHDQQQPWDPDFSYAFGYRRSAADGSSVVAEYANYSGNRWPGRTRGAGEGSFRSGSLLLSWATAW